MNPQGCTVHWTYGAPASRSIPRDTAHRQHAGTPLVSQDAPREVPAECGSATREKEEMRQHFECEERSGGVRAYASRVVVSLPDQG